MIDDHNYYLDIAEVARTRSTCLRRQFGVVLVKDDQVISTGFNGAPSDEVACSDSGVCERIRLGCPAGERYEICKAIHAEQMALLNVSRQKAVGSTLYLVGADTGTTGEFKGSPCKMCTRFIKYMGVEKVVVRETKDRYRIIKVPDELDYSY